MAVDDERENQAESEAPEGSSNAASDHDESRPTPVSNRSKADAASQLARSADAASSSILRYQSDALRAIRPQFGLAEQLAKAVQPFASSALMEQFRAADYLIPQGLRNLELVGTARIAEIMGAQSALAGWRQSLLTLQTATALANASQLRFEPMGAALLSDLTRISRVGVSLAETAARLSAAGAFTSVLSQPPTQQLHRYLIALPEPPSIHQVAFGARASHSVAGLVGIEVTNAVTDDGDALEEAMDEIEGEVIAPWFDGPIEVRNQMLERLGRVDPALPDLLHGAWDDVVRNGPGATVKIASCAVEVLERVLRALAPNEAVMAWHTEHKRPGNELDSNGNPTYQTRARYVLRDNRGERRLVVSQVEAVYAQVPELRSRFQAGKHASSGTLVALKCHLLVTEAVLTQLLLEN